MKITLHSKREKSKNNIILFFAILISSIAYSQVAECPDKKDQHYKCGNVEESILIKLENIEYIMTTKFNVTLSSSFNRKKHKEKAEKILTMINKVLNDNEFWKAIRYYDNYKDTRWRENDSLEWKEISGEQIINVLINGKPSNDNRPKKINIDLNVKLYGMFFKVPIIETALAKEIGDGNIYNKRWFFNKYPVSSIGSNWIHEFSHSKGISHCYYCDENRDYSIPYVINRIFTEVAAKYI